MPADPSTRSRGFDLELSGRQQDGTTFPANITVSHVDTGNVLLAVTAVGDVARLRRGDKHAELIEAIVRYSDDFIISRTLDGIITSWNPAAERMYGYLRKDGTAIPVWVTASPIRDSHGVVVGASVIGWGPTEQG